MIFVSFLTATGAEKGEKQFPDGYGEKEDLSLESNGFEGLRLFILDGHKRFLDLL